MELESGSIIWYVYTGNRYKVFFTAHNGVRLEPLPGTKAYRDILTDVDALRRMLQDGYIEEATDGT